MWDSLWINVHAATMDNNRLIRDAAIGVQQGKIIWIGPQCNLPDHPDNLAKQVFSMNNEWVTPGFIDCHTHTVFAGNRADEFARRLEGESYEAILAAGGGILSTVRATREASVETLLSLAKKRVDQALAQGVTTMEIKSGYGLSLEAELKILRVIQQLKTLTPMTLQATCLAAHTIPPEYKNQRTNYVNEIIDKLLPQVKQENLANSIDVFCEKIAFNLEETEKLFQAAKNLGFSIKVHGEQLSSFGATQLAAQYQALSVDHVEYATESDIIALKNAGSVAVLLPGAFYFLREQQCPPINSLRQHHVPMALATDFNPGTSPISSLCTIMNLACVLWRFTPEEALRGVTINAAKALGLASEIGSLMVGKQADFVLWQVESVAELAYSLNGPVPRYVVKNGIPASSISL